MGGGSKGQGMRPELPVALAPSPRVTPVEQPNPPAQQNYGSYYMPNGVEALRQSLMTQNGSMPFGVRSPYRQVAPDSSYAAPRMPQVFRPAQVTLPQALAPEGQSDLSERIRTLEEQLAASRDPKAAYGGTHY